MSIKHWYRALHIRERYLAKFAEIEREQDERLHRLEIAMRRAMEKIGDLEASVESTRQRQNAIRAGRPPKVRPGEQLALDAIPKGDKAALRAYFAQNPPPRDGALIQEH